MIHIHFIHLILTSLVFASNHVYRINNNAVEYVKIRPDRRIRSNPLRGVRKFLKDSELHTYHQDFQTTPLGRGFLRGINTNLRLDMAKRWINKSPGPVVSLDRKGVVEFAKGLSGNVIECQNPQCLELIGDIFRVDAGMEVPELAQREYSGVHIAYIIRLLRREATALDPSFRSISKMRDAMKKAQGLTTDVRKNYAGLIIKEAREAIVGLGLQFLEDVFSNEEACKALTASQIGRLISENTGRALTAECLKNAADAVSGASPSGDHVTLNEGSLSLFNGTIPSGILSKLSSKLVSDIGSQLSELAMVGKLNFGILNGTNVRGITRKHLIWRLRHGALTTMAPGAFKNLNPGIFKDIDKLDSESLKNIGKSLMKEAPPEMVNELVKNPLACSILHFSNITSETLIESKECFENMDPCVKASTLLKTKNLPENALSTITWSELDQLRISTKTGTLKGLQIFKFDQITNPRLGKMITYIGEDSNGKNPCSSFPSGDMIAQIPLLLDNITARCFWAKPRGSEDKEKYPVRLKYILPFAALLGKPNSFWEEIDQNVLSMIVSGKGFCPFVGKTLFDNIPNSVLAAVDAECVEGLKFLGELSHDQVVNFANDAFSRLNNDKIPPPIILMMSAEQLSNACTKASDLSKNNLGPKIDKDLLSKFSNDQIKGLTSEQLKEMPPSSYASFTTQTMELIVPDRMVYFTKEQCEQAKCPAFVNLNDDQAKRIGESSNQSPLEFLVNCKEIPLSARSIINGRLPDNKQISLSGDRMVWVTIIVIIALVILVIGGGALLYLMLPARKTEE